MKRLFTSSLYLFAALAASVFIACSDDDGPAGCTLPTGIELDRSEVELLDGENVRLAASLLPADAEGSIVWSSDDEAVASVSESGLVEAHAAGTATVTAACGALSASCTVRVIAAAETYDIISFEPAEGLVDFLGESVAPGEIEVVGGSAAGKHSGVFWANCPAYADYMTTDPETPGEGDPYSTCFDGPLFATADQLIWFGSYYSDNGKWGSRMDSWSGFVLTTNYDRTATSSNYADQFKVWAPTGARNTGHCVLAYSSPYGTYATPTVAFTDQPRTVHHCYLANSTVTYNYEPSSGDASAFEFEVIVTGWLDEAQIGTVECKLINGAGKASDWVRVDLSSLGRVDKLTFGARSNDVGAYGDNAPAYFALDEIALVKE